ncbi:hypothetical protein GQ600_23869 [Phytophthora cactorum]|nr:hypothetical protein GQ600_23869 [Phytophthora cactorum]
MILAVVSGSLEAKVKRRVSLGTQSEAGILADKIPKAKINQILPSGLTIRGLKKESKGRAGSRCTQHLSFTDAFGVFGIPMLLILVVCIVWTIWLIFVGLAPNWQRTC